MANKNYWLGILVMVLVFGMMVVGCDDGSTSGSSDPKTLVITNVPVNVYSYASSGGLLGVFTAGTTVTQALNETGLVAGAYMNNPDISSVLSGGNYRLSIPLYTPSGSTRWTGSGKYDVYVVLNGGGGHYYKASSVNISSETTTISFGNATEVFP
jgi:hypothetical protein